MIARRDFRVTDLISVVSLVVMFATGRRTIWLWLFAVACTLATPAAFGANLLEEWDACRGGASNPDAAIEACTKLISHARGDGTIPLTDTKYTWLYVVYHNRGVNYARKEQWELALSDQNSALAWNPAEDERYGDLVSKASALLHLGRYDEAIATCTEYLAVRGGQCHAIRAIAQAKKGNCDQALAEIDTYQGDPRDSDSFRKLWSEARRSCLPKTTTADASRSESGPSPARCTPNKTAAINRTSVPGATGEILHWGPVDDDICWGKEVWFRNNTNKNLMIKLTLYECENVQFGMCEPTYADLPVKSGELYAWPVKPDVKGKKMWFKYRFAVTQTGG